MGWKEKAGSKKNIMIDQCQIVNKFDSSLLKT